MSDEADSQVDARQMVEVIAEFQKTQRERLEASQNMIVPYVIRAVLDGADPKELAQLCGFKDDAPERELTGMDSLFGGASIFGGRRIDAVTKFAAWLSNGLATLIEEKNA